MEFQKIHLIGICGTGMGSLAILLQESGCSVRGSDRGVYPPMSALLQKKKIPILEGYRKENLDWGPEMVVVGNVVSRSNPEARAVLDRGLPYKSFPQTLAEYFLRDRHGIVVAGTHGKTSTSSLLAWILHHGGAAPGYLIGGVPINFGVSARKGKGELFVLEGDEYETAFFDKSPKLWHYHPRTAILTSVEFDHAEMFRDLDQVKAAFRKFLRGLPRQGVLLACGDDPGALELSREAPCAVETYGIGKDCQWRGEQVEEDISGMTIQVFHENRPFITVWSPLSGRQNLRNLLATIAVAQRVGIAKPLLVEAVSLFQGIARRQQVLGEPNGIIIIDDFAHHPTAVRDTLDGLRSRYSGRRLWAVFEPRTNTSRRRVFQEAYARSFGGVDRVIIAPVHQPDRAPPGDRLSPGRLVRDLKARKIDARCFSGEEEILKHLKKSCKQGDVVIFLSNGSFGGIQGKLLERLT